MRTRVGLLAVAALILIAGPAFAASDATVGDFVIKLAKARNLAATDAGTAVNSLRGVGVRVPDDLDHAARLTESDVVRLSRLFGLHVTSTTPEDSFDSDQVDRFFATFGSDIRFNGSGGASDATAGAANGGGQRFDPYGRGRRSANGNGKKKGHNKTPKDPA